MSSVNEKVVLGLKDHANQFSIRFMDLLRENELVDVILVADGQIFSAHRLILSALSPSFRKMFKQMLVNQQAYVFMNGISKETMEHLINYMYNGEVELHHESLADFIEKAKSLEIDGVSDESYCQSFGQQQSAQNGSNHRGMQYQTSHINRFQNSYSAGNKTLPTLTLGPIHHSQSGDFAVSGNGIDHNNDSNGSLYDGMDDNYGFDSNVETGNHFDSMDQKFDPQNVQGYQTYDEDYENQATEISTAKEAKRAKRKNDTSDYEIAADIRMNAKGGENLFHQDKMFSKHGAVNAQDKQRWQCSKRSVKNPCKAATSTMNVNGVVMMKVLFAEHSH